MTKVMTQHVDACMKRPLEKRYVCVYIDSTYIAIKREAVSKEAVYLAVGIREDGTKEVLTYAIQEIYPQAKYQSCCVHVARNIAHKVCVTDHVEICEDFKSVYRSDDEEAG
jgi:putative transposase